MKKASIFLLISMFFAFTYCGYDEVEINNLSDLEIYLLEEMEYENIPAMSVLIFNTDQIVYENYFGTSQIAQSISLDSDHMFLLASVSKVITATALLQLYDEGLFLLDDNINDYLPFNVKNPNNTSPITFRMLLTHTSAIADGSALDDQYYYGEDSPIALDFYLENYLVPGGDFYNANENFYDFEAGTEYEYSNTGNALIGLLVQLISGKDFDDYCKQNIFDPLGMTNTSWRLDEITQFIVQPYDYINGQNQVIDHYTFTDYPNGGLRSTSRDLFKLLTAFVNEGKSNNYQLLKANTVDAMVTPQIPTIDDEMGLHLFLLNSDSKIWGHDGGEQGVATIMGFNPETKVGAIILTNQGEAYLDDMLLEAYKFGIKD